MKFSVLLPTRNRLELLRYAVESVRRQDESDWEIIVSDNASTENVEGYVLAVNDPRIRYVRTAEFVSVTDNWNRALSNSSGDYVVMLGDDDCLLPGYFKRLSALIREFGSPDCVYMEAIQFAYPGVMPGHSKGFVQTGYSDLLRGRTAPSILDRGETIAAVRKSMELRLSFSYNMQHSLVSRRLIDRLASHGPFFQTPYPDYYATNVVFLAAKQVLVVPESLVAIGISPKSFGFYYFNSRVDEGMAFLNNLNLGELTESVRNSLLPGSPLITSWYLAMVQIERNYGIEHGVRVDTGRYRFLQVLDAEGQRGVGALRDYWPRLSWKERLRVLRMVVWLPRYGRLRLIRTHALHRVLAGARGRRVINGFVYMFSPFPSFNPQIKTVEYENILDLFDDIADVRKAPKLASHSESLQGA